MKIIFLHHSTGEHIWRGGVPEWFGKYNTDVGTHYRIAEKTFPKSTPYGWNNFPFDYWNIWINHAGNKPYFRKSNCIKNFIHRMKAVLPSHEIGEPTLEILTRQYDVIIWKHCFPVSLLRPDTGNPDILSNDKRIENYQLQYNTLKTKMHQFPKTKFIVWTGAALVENATDEKQAQHAKSFFDWVRNEWDEPGDNIFLWDFYELETEGGLYLKGEYAMGITDSHPNKTFSKIAAPLFCQRVVDVIEGRGDSGSRTVEKNNL